MNCFFFQVAGITDKFTGEITISGYDHDADDTDDFDISFKFNTEKNPKHPALDAFIRKNFPKSLWTAMQLYKETLRQDFAKKLAFEKMPAKEKSNDNKNSPPPPKPAVDPKNALSKPVETKKASDSIGTKISTKSISLTEVFMRHIARIFFYF